MLCGVFCFFFESLSTGGMAGNILAIVSGVTYAGVFDQKIPGPEILNSIAYGISSDQYCGGIPFLMRETVFTPTVWGYVLVLGIVQFGLSYVFLSRGLDRVSPVTASLTSTIEPI